ncbi:Glycosyltransferase [Methanosarcina siciliae T4/M]|uniref:Glycosyltransferase n=1 Tax=Methanosarcina siciliae T4/M TaxID=1434120 RepID=A0A0E3P983_9EURY|nr:glycosyltransferase family 4 protein [Methanosarcina siciliae]AKB30498.1 Glycosyltransferase [Methanosarcina siciliae T4/M]
MKTIAQYNPRFSPCIGGGETYVSNLVLNIKKYNFNIITNSLPYSPLEENFSENTLVKRFLPYDRNLLPFNNFIISKLSFPYRFCSDILRLQRKNEYLKKSTYDLIHFHGIGFCNNLLRVDTWINSMIFSKFIDFSEINTPKVITIHNLFSSLNNNPIFEKYELNMIDQFESIICVDKNIEIYVKNYSCLMNKDKKIHFIPNSVDINKFSFSELELKDKLVIGFVGRFEYSRGIDILKLLIENLPNFCELHITCNQILGVNNPNVYFHGILPENDIPSFIKSMDIIFNPVLVEGISRITLEAMSCGRPVIMIDKGDRYPVFNGKTGYIIKENIDELLFLLEYLYDNENKLKEIGYNARQTVEREFSNEVIIPKIIRIYDELIE